MDEAESRARAVRDMAAIKAREADVRAALDRGDVKISGAGGFTMSQLGLTIAMIDGNGRIWRDAGGGELVLVYPPSRLAVIRNADGKAVGVQVGAPVDDGEIVGRWPDGRVD